MKKYPMYETIETAPKDGTYILVWDTEEKCWQKVSWIENSINYPNGYLGWCWCIYGSWQDEQGGYQTVIRPPVWINLPVDYE